MVPGRFVSEEERAYMEKNRLAWEVRRRGWLARREKAGGDHLTTTTSTPHQATSALLEGRIDNSFRAQIPSEGQRKIQEPEREKLLGPDTPPDAGRVTTSSPGTNDQDQAMDHFCCQAELSTYHPPRRARRQELTLNRLP